MGYHHNEKEGVIRRCCCNGLEDFIFHQVPSKLQPVFNTWTARYVYGLMFLISNIVAWMIRDYSQNALSVLERLKACDGARECLGAEGVLRISLGCFIFFFAMFISTVGTSKLNGTRDSWHSTWWCAKMPLWVALMCLPFFLPSDIVYIYGEMAHIGAGVFLLIQLFSIINFIKWLNDRLNAETWGSKCRAYIYVSSCVFYMASFSGIILMYIWYASKLTCFRNICFITWTFVLIQLMTCVSLHPKINGGLFTPGLMGLYVVFLCWTAIRSEQPAENCSRQTESTSGADWFTIINFVVALLSIVIATFATGIDSKCFQLIQFRRERAPKEDDVPYGYGFFHFVFAMGAMYFGMLFIGWKVHNTMKKWTIDVGWISTWVKVGSEHLAACLYILMLIAPTIREKLHLFKAHQRHPDVSGSSGTM